MQPHLAHGSLRLWRLPKGVLNFKQHLPTARRGRWQPQVSVHIACLVHYHIDRCAACTFPEHPQATACAQRKRWAGLPWLPANSKTWQPLACVKPNANARLPRLQGREEACVWAVRACGEGGGRLCPHPARTQPEGDSRRQGRSLLLACLQHSNEYIKCSMRLRAHALRTPKALLAVEVPGRPPTLPRWLLL